MYVSALLIASLSKLEGPFFLGAFLISAWAIFIATAPTVLTIILPKKLEPLRGYIQTLGLGSAETRQDSEKG
jgi:hypothetical protein